MATAPNPDNKNTYQQVLNALNADSKVKYEVTDTGGGVYKAKCGSLGMNILCGCCAQYYEFTIDCSQADKITYKSDVPCGGWWGGAIGAQKNNNEKNRLGSALRAQFPGLTVAETK